MKHLYSENSARRSWPTKALTSAVLLSLTTMLSQTAGSAESAPIGDLEIYKRADGSGASIFMMIDVSASMGESSIKKDYNEVCDSKKNSSYDYQTSDTITAYVKDKNGKYVEVEAPRSDGSDRKGTFTPKGCQAQNGGGKEFDRLSRLQMALIEVFADRVERQKGNDKVVSNAGSLPNEYAVGIGIFGYGDGKKAKVIAPLGSLDVEQRSALIQEIAALTVEDNTNKPVAQALAEAGAYMMGTTTKTPAYLDYSGFNDSVVASRTHKEISPPPPEARYISPLKSKQCSGDGIYLLTDGVPSLTLPDATTLLPDITKSLMNQSLEGSSLSVDNCRVRFDDSTTNITTDSTLGCMANYTQQLRNLDNPIRTAIAGYGDSFKGLTATKEITVDGEDKDVVNCSGTAGIAEKALCKIGERFGDNPVAGANVFGDGGFYYIAGEKGVSNQDSPIGPRSSQMIADSVVEFAASLTQIIETSPSGTITIPDDPYRASNQLPYAYLPMLNPNVASNASIWKGNLKKYNLNKGTLYGNSDELLYQDTGGRLKSATQDIWQTTDFTKDNVTANNEIEAGGVYAQLKSPSSENLSSVRTLYVEDIEEGKPILRQLSVNSAGQPQGFGALKDPIYDELNKRRLLSFLGFSQVLDINGQPTDNTLVANLTLSPPEKETTVLGGVVHSKPTAISYSSALDKNGRIIDPREDYALFGSMDGALHLADASSGEETYAIIPKAMLENQPKALVPDSTGSKTGEPYFGVDAPWLVTTDYNYNLEGKKVTVDGSSDDKGMFAYGGLRMGGDGLYGIDITSKSSPKMLFTITKDGLSSTTVNASTTTGFERLGQTWSKPTAAKIRISKDADPIDVLVFGGGYDMAYEDDEYVATIGEPAKGNAIYMINAQSGALIWSASQSDNSGLIHSITGGITVLDRDNDGLMDHLYAADLGGQVFRADFQNARPAKFGFPAVDEFSIKEIESNNGITRILKTATASTKPYRFYERPVVSFYRGESGINNGKIFAMVNVISGNRSGPLSTLRDGNTYANRVYGIIDNDVTQSGLYDDDMSLTIKNLTENELVNLASTLGDSPSKDDKTDAKAAMIDGSKHGWYYPLTRFDGYNNVRYNKGIGDSVVINDLLYTTVYNPDKAYYEVDSCTASIAGGSERQLYCLPYGICMDDNSISGTGGYTPAGQGIQELTLGAYDKDNTDIKVLVGTTTIEERIKVANRTGYGTDTLKNSSNIKDITYNDGKTAVQEGAVDGISNNGTNVNGIGDGSAAEYLFNERYTLQPKAWYERK